MPSFLEREVGCELTIHVPVQMPWAGHYSSFCQFGPPVVSLYDHMAASVVGVC
jgi:hypothetical protein